MGEHSELTGSVAVAVGLFCTVDKREIAIDERIAHDNYEDTLTLKSVNGSRPQVGLF